MESETTDSLRAKIEVMKQKTREYVAKIQGEHALALETERKSTQDKIEAVKAFVSKEREARAVAEAESLRLQTELQDLKDSQNKLDQNTESTVSSICREKVEDQNATFEKEMERISLELSVERDAKAALGKELITLREQLERSSTSIQELENEIKKLKGVSEREAATKADLQREVDSLKESQKTSKQNTAKASSDASDITSLNVELGKERDTVKTLQDRLESEALKADEATQALQNELQSMKKELLDTKEAITARQTALTESNVEIDSLRKQLSVKSNELQIASAGKSEELKRLEHDMREASKTLSDHQVDKTNLMSKIGFFEAQISSMREQNTELIRSHEEATKQLKLKESQLDSLTNSAADMAKKIESTDGDYAIEQQRLRDEVSTIQKTNDGLRDELASKQIEANSHKQQVQNISEVLDDLKNQHETLKSERNSISEELQSELIQTQERKKKVRGYVDNINAEKKMLEDKVVDSEAKLTDALGKLALREQDIKVYATRLATLEQQINLDLEHRGKEAMNLQKGLKDELNGKSEEIERLRMEMQLKSNADSSMIVDIQNRLRTASLETEEHKSKRLAARQEMIMMAGSLEKFQSEAQELQNFLQFSVLPSIVEQVLGLEHSLVSLENATSQIASKKMMKLKTKTSQLLSKRAIRADQGTRQGGEFVRRGETALTPGQKRITSQKNSGGPLGEAMDQAVSARSELDRVAIGITLLGQSLDRLHEIVHVDTRCCGLFDTVASIGSRKEGYSVLDADSDSGVDTSVELTSSLNRGTPSSSTKMIGARSAIETFRPRGGVM
jgi:chromosome segregation ATPase